MQEGRNNLSSEASTLHNRPRRPLLDKILRMLGMVWQRYSDSQCQHLRFLCVKGPGSVSDHVCVLSVVPIQVHLMWSSWQNNSAG